MAKMKKTVTLEEVYLKELEPVLEVLDMSVSDLMNSQLRRFYTFLRDRGVLESEHLDFVELTKLYDELMTIPRHKGFPMTM